MTPRSSSSPSPGPGPSRRPTHTGIDGDSHPQPNARSQSQQRRRLEDEPQPDLEALTRRVEQLERTLSAVCNASIGATVAGPCTHCERSLLLVRDGMITCPCCGYRRSV